MSDINNQVCPYKRHCGGCKYQGMTNEEQAAEKQKYVNQLLKPFGKVEPIITMGYPYHYRNKVHAVYGIQKGGKIICGTYKEGTHDIVDIEECLIEDKKADSIIRDIKDMIRSFRIKTYDEDTGYGLLRHVLVKRGFATGEIMVVLVLGSPILPSKNNFVKALRDKHPEITTILLNVNDKRSSMILGDKETVLYGPGYIVDELLGCKFRISAKSFYQVNPVQTKHLYRTAIEYAGLTGKERVLDAYCGIGTIGLIASSKAKQVLAVEINHDAVQDAIRNARLNHNKKVRFYEQDASEFMMQMAAANDNVDVVFMDPPRAGSDEVFLSSLKKLNPAKVVYISCNPETLARDLKSLTKQYRVEKIQPVDMFPFTGAIETVVLLVRK